MAGLAALLAGALTAAYIWRLQPEMVHDLRVTLVFTVLALAYLALTSVVFHQPLPALLLVPTAAVAMIFSALSGPQAAILAIGVLSGQAALILEGQP